VAKLLNSLGFDNEFDYQTGLLKFVHPDLEIQFLTPALGRGKDGPYEIRKLNINAEGLRYMTLLRDYIFHMIYKDITISITVLAIRDTVIIRVRVKPVRAEDELVAGGQPVAVRVVYGIFYAVAVRV
jgi:hypothetical protein